MICRGFQLVQSTRNPARSTPCGTDTGGAETAKPSPWPIACAARPGEQMLQQLAQVSPGCPYVWTDSHSSSSPTPCLTSTPATPLASAKPHAGRLPARLIPGGAVHAALFVVLGPSLLLFGVAPTLADWARAQQWQATPAIVGICRHPSGSLQDARQPTGEVGGGPASLHPAGLGIPWAGGHHRNTGNGMPAPLPPSESKQQLCWSRAKSWRGPASVLPRRRPGTGATAQRASTGGGGHGQSHKPSRTESIRYRPGEQPAPLTHAGCNMAVGHRAGAERIGRCCGVGQPCAARLWTAALRLAGRSGRPMFGALALPLVRMGPRVR